MLRSLVPSAALACAAAALPGAIGAPTLAEEMPPTRAVLRDGPGDVWAGNDVMPRSRWVKVGRRPAFDVTRALVEHRAGAVVVRLRYADLRRVGELVYEVRVRTAERTARAMVYSGVGYGKGFSMLVEDDAEWTSIPCPGFAHVVDFGTDLVVVRIPRGCLGEPDWVEVHAESSAFVEPTGGSRWSAFADNPHNHRADSEGFTTRLYRP